MNLEFGAGLFLLIFSVVLSLGMIVYFWLQGKKTAVLYSFLLCQALICLWSLFHIFDFLSVTIEARWVFVVIEYFAICFIGAAWLLFSLYYANSWVIRFKKNLVWIFTPPLILYCFALTNTYHHLFFQQFTFEGQKAGILFWVHTVFSYIYLVSGTAILMRCSTRQLGNARKQSLLFILAVLIPLVCNAIYISNAIITKVDITSVSFSISLLLFALATFRYRFLNIVPIALRKVVDHIKESVIVIDQFNRVLDFNKPFSDTFSSYVYVSRNDNINKFIKELRKHIDKAGECNDLLNTIEYGCGEITSGEIIVSEPVRTCFVIGIQQVLDRKQQVLGRVVTFNDISEYRALMNELNTKNRALSEANEQLKEHMHTVEELAVANERNRFARDVHDTLGHTMALLIAQLEVCSISYAKDPKVTEEKLADALETARGGLKELRRSIVGLMPEKLESNSLVNALKRLVHDFSMSGMKIDFTVDGPEPNLNVTYRDVIYRLCQEALTNSLRHGRAKNASIILRFQEDRAKVYIFDDGCGSKNIIKGFGLSGMEDRINSLSGKLRYGSDGESGFNIHAEIPIGDGSQND